MGRSGLQIGTAAITGRSAQCVSCVAAEKIHQGRSHVLDYSELELQPDLSYTEQPMAIMDRSVKTLKNRTISLVLVS